MANHNTTPNTPTGAIVREYLTKYPNTANRNKTALALLIYDEYNHLFDKREYVAVENIRNVLRYYKGASGEYNRKNIKTKQFL